MTDLLIAISVAVLIGSQIAHHLGRISTKTRHGLYSIGFTLGAAAFALLGLHILAYLWATLAACSAWLWWKGGGDDDTKRRLRAGGRAFRGVRRTAPVTT